MSTKRTNVDWAKTSTVSKGMWKRPGLLLEFVKLGFGSRQVA